MEVNNYTWADLAVGTTESFETEVTSEKMQLFCELSGDVSPIHMDSAVAKARGMKDRVVYGMLSASFVSTLAGVYLPGKSCLLQEVDTKFTKPVYIGDKLRITGRVSEVHPELPGGGATYRQDYCRASYHQPIRRELHRKSSPRLL
jgi:3-hydroxybutyryl-CoA dehydratase